jgi:hypothetical protein
LSSVELTSIFASARRSFGRLFGCIELDSGAIPNLNLDATINTFPVQLYRLPTTDMFDETLREPLHRIAPSESTVEGTDGKGRRSWVSTAIADTGIVPFVATRPQSELKQLGLFSTCLFSTLRNIHSKNFYPAIRRLILPFRVFKTAHGRPTR